jgi:hypothetical protein
MFGNTKHALPMLNTYAKAHEYFNNRKPVRSARWLSTARPLHTTAATHYRIEQGANAEYYDIFLYSLAVGRLYKPEANGNETRMYLNYPSQSTADFLDRVLWVKAMTATGTADERLVYRFIGNAAGIDADNRCFNARHVFNDRGEFLPELSFGPTAYKKVSNPDDKKKRKLLKQFLAPYVMLAGLRVPEYLQNARVSHQQASPFTSSVHTTEVHTLRFLMDDLLINAIPSDNCIKTLFDVGQTCYDMLASKRVDKYDKDSRSWSNRILGWAQTPLTNIIAEHPDANPNITSRDLELSLTNALIKSYGAHEKSGKIDYPMFPEVNEVSITNVHF